MWTFFFDKIDKLEGEPGFNKVEFIAALTNSVIDIDPQIAKYRQDQRRDMQSLRLMISQT